MKSSILSGFKSEGSGNQSLTHNYRFGIAVPGRTGPGLGKPAESSEGMSGPRQRMSRQLGAAVEVMGAPPRREKKAEATIWAADPMF